MNAITASAGDYSLFGVKLGSNVEEIGDVLTTDATFLQTAPIVGGERVMLAEDATGYLINYDYGADGIIFSFGYVLEGQQMSEPVVEESNETSEATEDIITEETIEQEDSAETIDEDATDVTSELETYDENGVIIAYKTPGMWGLEENSSGDEVSDVAEVYLEDIVGLSLQLVFI